jgi:16S rRNA (guanine966-N2)-methyltransferase
LRIIGGQWRGRRIRFHAEPGLRPTPDRVRETLFNWLQPHMEGSRCLDLFCGSGALGIEALSRGASHVTFVDASAAALQDLRENLGKLTAEGAELIRGDVFQWLKTAPTQSFDIVFLDPPFRNAMARQCVAALAASGKLASRVLVYVESGANEEAPELPVGWRLHREKFAGQVAYRLYRTWNETEP